MPTTPSANQARSQAGASQQMPVDALKAARKVCFHGNAYLHQHGNSSSDADPSDSPSRVGGFLTRYSRSHTLHHGGAEASVQKNRSVLHGAAASRRRWTDHNHHRSNTMDVRRRCLVEDESGSLLEQLQLEAGSLLRSISN